MNYCVEVADVNGAASLRLVIKRKARLLCVYF